MDLNNKVNSTDTNAAAFAKGNNKSSVFNDGIDNRFNAHEELKKSFIDPDVDEPEPETIISINDSPVASKQNISVIIGAAKAGKTFLCLLVLAAINGASIDGLGVMEGSKAAYFDTEQARPHIRRMINRLKELGGNISQTSFFSLRAYQPKERFEIITEYIKTNPDTKLIIIDGVRDLVFDINRPDEAVIVVTDLMKLTELYNVHIMLILHQNKADKNARGHLGTECVNKSETTISLRYEKDNNIRIAEPQFTRNKPFDPLAFSINEEGVPEMEEYSLVKDPEKNKKNKITPHQIDHSTHRDILINVFQKLNKPKRSELLSQIKLEYEKYGVSFGDNKARDFLNYYKVEKLIEVHGNSLKTYYTLCIDDKDGNSKNNDEVPF